MCDQPAIIFIWVGVNWSSISIKQHCLVLSKRYLYLDMKLLVILWFTEL
jgi:hypothetical protein